MKKSSNGCSSCYSSCKLRCDGSQALINVTVHNSGKMFLVYNKLTYHAEATVIEFDE